MPSRLPSRVKALRGTLRRDRVNAREPRPKVDAPRPSRDLPMDVRREFDKLGRRLAPLGVVTVVDGLAQELCALALAETWRYEAILRARGATYETTTPAGSTMIRQRPEVTLMADAWRRATAMLQQFGMTPVSRSKVEAIPPDTGGSKWAGLLRGDRDPLERLLRAKESASVEAFQRQRPRAKAGPV